MAKMSGPSCAQLPPEIWQNICNNIPSDRHRYGTLSSLSKTSEGLRAIAQPILWSKFSTRHERHLVPFTKSVINHPALAKHVEDVEIYPLQKPLVTEAVEEGDEAYFIDEAAKSNISLSWEPGPDRKIHGDDVTGKYCSVTYVYV